MDSRYPVSSMVGVTSTTGSDTFQASSPVTFNVDLTGLSPGTYTATLIITPMPEAAATVTITLTVN